MDKRKTFHSVHPAGVSLMLPMKRHPCATLHSPCSYVNTDIHALRVIYRKAVWSAVSWRVKMNLLLHSQWSSQLTAQFSTSQSLSQESKNMRLQILQIMEVCQRPKACWKQQTRWPKQSHPGVLAACQPHPSTQQTMKTQEFTFLEEIKPWFQYTIIILTHVRVGIIKRQVRSSFNKETLTSNIYSWFQICRYWEAMPTADQWVGRNKSIFTFCLCYKCKTGFIFTHLMIIPFYTGVSLVAQASLELLILLPWPPSVEITDKGRAPHQRWWLSCWVATSVELGTAVRWQLPKVLFTEPFCALTHHLKQF